MKANEVPEKLYVHINILGDVSAYKEDWCRPPHCVEYIRKDAFIEKAEEFINSALNDGIMGTANIEDFMRLFKKYMEE